MAFVLTAIRELSRGSVGLTAFTEAHCRTLARRHLGQRWSSLPTSRPSCSPQSTDGSAIGWPCESFSQRRRPGFNQLSVRKCFQ